MQAKYIPSTVYDQLVEAGFFGSPERRSFISYAVRRLEKCIEALRPLMVIAPPGIGKTALAYSAGVAVALNYPHVLRVIHVLPLRSIVDDVYERFGKGLERVGVSRDLNIVARQYGMLHGSPYLQATYVATTVDTYAFSLLKLPVGEYVNLLRYEGYHGHYELPRASIYSALNFMDEAHLMLEDATGVDRGASFIRTVIHHLSQTNTPLVVATATLPSRVVDLIKSIAGELEVVNYAEFVGKQGEDEFCKFEVEKRFNPIGRGLEEAQRLLDRIDECTGAGRLCIFTNTVKSALDLFNALGRKPILLHSRFTPKDRAAKLEALKRSNITVSTQVLEAGVDVSFDVVLTELAPISSLIQRLGRLARGSVKEGSWLIFYDDQSLTGRSIYDPDVTRETFNALLKFAVKGNVHWHLPRLPYNVERVGYMQLIDAVWGNLQVVGSLDLDVLDALERLDVESRKVLEYLEKVGSFVRDENLAPLYIGVPEEDYASFRESVAERLIPMGLSEAARYVRLLLEKGFQVHLVKGKTEGGGLKLDVEELKASQVTPSTFERRLRMELVSGSALALAIPEELYEGGVYGRGILWP